MSSMAGRAIGTADKRDTSAAEKFVTAIKPRAATIGAEATATAEANKRVDSFMRG